jgi:hypothetical protein
MKRVFVVMVVLGLVTRGDRPPSRLHALRGVLAPYAKRMGVVVVRDAKGRPISYRVFKPDR